MPEQTRTFIAAVPSDGARRRALSLVATLQAAGADVRWSREENLHFTIKFLGDLGPGQLRAVCQTASDVAGRHAPFSIQLRGAGAFPNAARPGTIWLGAGDGQAAMADLAKDLDRALRKLRFPKERRAFHSHVTLGRVRRGGGPQFRALADAIREQNAFDGGPTTIRELVVFASRLTSPGPIYEMLHRAELAGGEETEVEGRKTKV